MPDLEGEVKKNWKKNSKKNDTNIITNNTYFYVISCGSIFYNSR